MIPPFPQRFRLLVARNRLSCSLLGPSTPLDNTLGNACLVLDLLVISGLLGLFYGKFCILAA